MAQTQTIASESLRKAAQTLFAEVQPYLNFEQGEVTMFVMDMPDVPPQYAPVVIAQGVQTQPQAPVGSAKIDRTIGVCQLIENPVIPPGTAVNAMSPVTAVWGYLQRMEKLTPEQLTDDMFISAKTTLLQGPVHGTFEYTGEGYFEYHPTSGHYGSDRATVLVEIGSYKVKVIYHINVMKPGIGGTDGYDPYMQKQNCPKGREWKISFNENDPTGQLLTFNNPTQLTSYLAGAVNVVR